MLSYCCLHPVSIAFYRRELYARGAGFGAQAFRCSYWGCLPHGPSKGVAWQRGLCTVTSPDLKFKLPLTRCVSQLTSPTGTLQH